MPNTFYLEHKYNNLDIYKSYNTYLFTAFLLVKEKSDLKLLLKLRKDSLIKTPSTLFEALQKQEIEGLIARKVFSF
jgi:hypothetical protein